MLICLLPYYSLKHILFSGECSKRACRSAYGLRLKRCDSCCRTVQAQRVEEREQTAYGCIHTAFEFCIASSISRIMFCVSSSCSCAGSSASAARK